VEMEYQKSARHHLSQRPDIIYHIPADVSHPSVKDGNFAVWALKYMGSARVVEKDLRKLDQMCRVLDYRLALFVNVSSSKTHLDAYVGRFRDRLHAFAVPGVRGSSITHSYFSQGCLTEVHLPL
jgi:hypothetical protein